MKQEIEVGGRKISFDSETFAQQATAGVMVRSGDTMVLTTIVFGKPLEVAQDFLPLTVEYREHISAAGKFPGGFFKREGRPTEKEILTCRLIDRTIRPLIPKSINREIQVSSFIFSADPDIDPDILASLGASACLSLSPFPSTGPVATVRVGMVNDQLILNPTNTQLLESGLSLVVSAGAKSLVMMEGIAKNIPEEKVLSAIAYGIQESQKLVGFLSENFSVPKEKVPEPEKAEWEDAISRIFDQKFSQVANYPGKTERSAFFDSIKQELVGSLAETVPEKEIKEAFERELRIRVRKHILETKTRLDGRKPAQIRPISCEVGLLPRVHGSALFRRGETQALALVTLGTWANEQRVEGLLEEIKKRFILHYNFPPFSVGEVKPMRGPGRREIGHGAMAEKALVHLLPPEEGFPYTIRVVSDILESHGSSSMATVCAGSLALMDAGVPMTAPAGGVALGLILQDENTYLILTDIAGEEDHYGDLDLKIAGTKEGITAIQMDVKTTKLTLEVLRQAFQQSREARCQILDTMAQVLPAPRPSLSSYAPKIVTLKIPTDKIGAVIGPGGRNIRKIIADTGAEIEIEDDGGVQIIAKDEAAQQKAISVIKGLVEEPIVGQVYNQVKVTRLFPFGAMVEYLPGQEGLVHISELDHRYVNKPDEVVKIGDLIDVKIVGIDNQHRVNLSRKALLPAPPGGTENEPRPGRIDHQSKSNAGGRRQPNLTHRAYRSGFSKERKH